MKSLIARERGLPLFCLGSALILVYGRFFIGFAPAGRDIVLQYLPYQQLVRQAIWRGQWPLWNPATFCGRPLMADIQVGVLYPPNWLHWVLPLPVSFAILFLAHTAWSLWGCFRLGKTWNFSSPASCLTAVLYTFCGFLSVKLQTGIILFHYAASWLPWSVLALTALYRAPSLRSAIVLGLALAMSLLAGAPQIAFYSWLLVGGLAVGLTLGGKRVEGEEQKAIIGAKGKFLCGVAGAFGLAVALTLIQTYQTYQMTSVSFDRGLNVGISKRWETMTEGSLRPDLMSLILDPDWFGPGNDEMQYAGPETGFSEACAYLPWLAWGLLLPLGELMWRSLSTRARRIFICSLLLAIFSVLMAMGHYSPIFRFFFDHVPGFDLFRVPARWMFGFNVAVSVASGAVFDELLRARPLTEKSKWTLLIVVGLSLAGLAAVRLGVRQSNSARGVETFAPIFKLSIPILVAIFSVWLFAFFPVHVGRACSQANGRLERPTYNLLQFLIPLLATLDLALVAWPNQAAVRADKFYSTFYSQTPLVKKLKEMSAGGRVLWTDGLLDWHLDQNTPEVVTNTLIMQGMTDARGYDPVNAWWIGTWFNRLAGLPPENNPRGYMRVPKIALPPWLTLMGVETILSYEDLSSLPELQLADRVDFPEGPLGIWTNKNYRGLAFAVPSDSSETNVELDDRAKAQSLSQRAALSNPTDPLKAVVFDSLNFHPSSFIPHPFGVRAVEEGPNRFAYQTDFPDAAPLLFAQSAYPGWSVKVNGAYAPLSVVCGTFLAVAVPAGKSLVEFEYYPPSGFEWAELTSLATAIVMIFCLIRDWRKGKTDAPIKPQTQP